MLAHSLATEGTVEVDLFGWRALVQSVPEEHTVQWGNRVVGKWGNRVVGKTTDDMICCTVHAFFCVHTQHWFAPSCCPVQCLSGAVCLHHQFAGCGHSLAGASNEQQLEQPTPHI